MGSRRRIVLVALAATARVMVSAVGKASRRNVKAICAATVVSLLCQGCGSSPDGHGATGSPSTPGGQQGAVTSSSATATLTACFVDPSGFPHADVHFSVGATVASLQAFVNFI